MHTQQSVFFNKTIRSLGAFPNALECQEKFSGEPVVRTSFTSVLQSSFQNFINDSAKPLLLRNACERRLRSDSLKGIFESIIRPPRLCKRSMPLKNVLLLSSCGHRAGIWQLHSIRMFEIASQPSNLHIRSPVGDDQPRGTRPLRNLNLGLAALISRKPGRSDFDGKNKPAATPFCPVPKAFSGSAVGAKRQIAIHFSQTA